MKYLFNFNHFLNESIEKERTRSSNWSKEYLMINYYFYRFGLDKLIGENFRTEQELCNLMGIPKYGLNMHDRNFVSLEKEDKLENDGLSDSGLSHTGRTLKEVYYEFSGYTESEFRNKIYPILDLIYKGYNNDYFLDKSKELKRTNKSNQLNQLKTELKEIIQNYDFQKGEKVILHLKKSKDDPFDIIITKGGKNPMYNRLDRNLGFEFGPLNKNLFDIIYPYDLDPKYMNIKID